MVDLAAAHDLVAVYLTAEQDGALEPLVERFAGVQTIRNAAQPPVTGPNALKEFCLSFWDRTEYRSFRFIDVAVAGRDVLGYAWATLRFRPGAAFGPVIARHSFTVELPLALRFHVDDAGLIDELDVFHETTSAVRLAADA